MTGSASPYGLRRTMDTSEMIKQIVYVSRATPELARQDVDQILDTARERNRSLDISGFLLFNGNRFVQLLEGPPGNVSSLYGMIEKDPRHQDTQILLEHFAPSRLLSSWAMAYAYLNGPDKGVFGGTLDRSSVREMASILRTGDSVLRQSIADTLLHLAGIDRYARKSFFAA